MRNGAEKEFRLAFDDIKTLIDAGKEKGCLTYNEVNELIPHGIHSPEDLDDPRAELPEPPVVAGLRIRVRGHVVDHDRVLATILFTDVVGASFGFIGKRSKSAPKSFRSFALLKAA